MRLGRYRVLAAVTCLASLGLGPAACSTTHAKNSDEALSIAGRIHSFGQPLSLNTLSLKVTPSEADANLFTYVGAVDAPVNPKTGTTVQATNFAFDDRHAYVVYNTAGDEVGGALEVVDIQDANRPALVGSQVFTTAEFADVRLVDHYALLVGHRSDGAGEAALVVVDIADPASPQAVTTLDLPGHAATSIAIDGTTAYVTTGDDGGLVQVDVSNITSPVVAHFTALPSALDVVRNYERTYVLGGSPASLYGVTDAQALTPYGAPLAAGALMAPGRLAVWNTGIFTNAGGSLDEFALDGSMMQSVSTLAGTSNGIDVGGGTAVLAQGEVGTSVYDVSLAGSAKALGTLAFPDERGSSNEVRMGVVANATYIFLGDGLGGFRIIRMNFSSDSDPVACTTPWWTASDGPTWWATPASTSGGSTLGTWSAAPESTSLCLVETFAPSLSNTNCESTVLKRVRAIGPQPNEGQTCPLTCPAGTTIANAHSRYGEASPLNADGDYSCTGTTTPDLNEISCDVMTDACNTGSQASCTVRYHNEYCGDPWVNCIKNGRTRWTCVPSAAPGH